MNSEIFRDVNLYFYLQVGQVFNVLRKRKFFRLKIRLSYYFNHWNEFLWLFGQQQGSCLKSSSLFHFRISRTFRLGKRKFSHNKKRNDIRLGTYGYQWWTILASSAHGVNNIPFLYKQGDKVRCFRYFS